MKGCGHGAEPELCCSRVAVVHTSCSTVKLKMAGRCLLPRFAVHTVSDSPCRSAGRGLNLTAKVVSGAFSLTIWRVSRPKTPAPDERPAKSWDCINSRAGCRLARQVAWIRCSIRRQYSRSATSDTQVKVRMFHRSQRCTSWCGIGSCDRMGRRRSVTEHVLFEMRTIRIWRLRQSEYSVASTCRFKGARSSTKADQHTHEYSTLGRYNTECAALAAGFPRRVSSCLFWDSNAKL